MKKYFLSFGLIFIILSITIFSLFINVFASGEDGQPLVDLLKQADSSVKAGEFQETGSEESYFRMGIGCGLVYKF